MKASIIEIVGWCGVCAIIAGYFFISYSLLSPTSIFYQLLNLSGAFGIVISSLSKRDYQPAVLNTVWLLIALFAIVKIFA